MSEHARGPHSEVVHELPSSFAPKRRVSGDSKFIAGDHLHEITGHDTVRRSGASSGEPDKMFVLVLVAALHTSSVPIRGPAADLIYAIFYASPKSGIYLHKPSFGDDFKENCDLQREHVIFL